MATGRCWIACAWFPWLNPRGRRSQLCRPAAVGLYPPMRHSQAMARGSTAEIPVDLRARLEVARLDLLALFHALDRMDLSPAEIPQPLIRQLFELEADYVEALWALDRPPGSLDLYAMLRDTLAALDQLRKLGLDCDAIFRTALIPSWPNWNSPFTAVSIRQRPTAWCPVAAPKTVKHPDAVHTIHPISFLI